MSEHQYSTGYTDVTANGIHGYPSQSPTIPLVGDTLSQAFGAGPWHNYPTPILFSEQITGNDAFQPQDPFCSIFQSVLTVRHPLVCRFLGSLPYTSPEVGMQTPFCDSAERRAMAGIEEIGQDWDKPLDVNHVLGVGLPTEEAECVFVLAALQVLLQCYHAAHFTLWGTWRCASTAQRVNTMLGEDFSVCLNAYTQSLLMLIIEAKPCPIVVPPWITWAGVREQLWSLHAMHEDLFPAYIPSKIELRDTTNVEIADTFRHADRSNTKHLENQHPTEIKGLKRGSVDLMCTWDDDIHERPRKKSRISDTIGAHDHTVLTSVPGLSSPQTQVKLELTDDWASRPLSSLEESTCPLPTDSKLRYSVPLPQCRRCKPGKLCSSSTAAGHSDSEDTYVDSDVDSDHGFGAKYGGKRELTPLEMNVPLRESSRLKKMAVSLDEMAAEGESIQLESGKVVGRKKVRRSDKTSEDRARRTHGLGRANKDSSAGIKQKADRQFTNSRRSKRISLRLAGSHLST
ncbi:hypothetical protein PHLCEN_2v2153 [Hermanssonia centrifuga]|uniref:Uncharacterized protein n=1 Tax=Hermanssonia centrifuga TaxID=98765 RepID=A0A2R6RPX8_9APHY|nr:hypothetical protein PHLCEN_2v2153 [Hermanssonia centrifuga]